MNEVTSVSEGKNIIKVRNLSYVYSPKSPFEHKALSKISLDIDEGDFFGIIGETGSGKSTLISHFNAITKVQPKANIIKQKKHMPLSELTVLSVDGIELTDKKPDLKRLRETVGMVFQYPEYQLFADTVIEDVSFGPKNMKLSPEECRDRAEKSLALTGIGPDLYDRSPFELSGGQKRRVAIAGVLAMNPRILVLDEPTAGLDPAGKKELIVLLKDIKKKIPVVIMVSHNMDEIAECCNKVAVLSEGKVMGVFSPRTLFGSYELIHSLGLELPVACEAALKLKNMGIDLPQSILTESELLEELKKWEGRR